MYFNYNPDRVISTRNRLLNDLFTFPTIYNPMTNLGAWDETPRPDMPIMRRYTRGYDDDDFEHFLFEEIVPSGYTRYFPNTTTFIEEPIPNNPYRVRRFTSIYPNHPDYTSIQRFFIIFDRERFNRDLVLYYEERMARIIALNRFQIREVHIDNLGNISITQPNIQHITTKSYYTQLTIEPIKGNNKISADCPICGDDVVPEDQVKTNCNHIFCMECVKQYANAKKDCTTKPNCPCCRGEFACLYVHSEDKVERLKSIFNDL